MTPDPFPIEVEYRTPQGVIDNWRRLTKTELIDTLTAYHEGMAELRVRAGEIDPERLARALRVSAAERGWTITLPNVGTSWEAIAAAIARAYQEDTAG